MMALPPTTVQPVSVTGELPPWKLVATSVLPVMASAALPSNRFSCVLENTLSETVSVPVLLPTVVDSRMAVLTLWNCTLANTLALSAAAWKLSAVADTLIPGSFEKVMGALAVPAAIRLPRTTMPALEEANATVTPAAMLSVTPAGTSTTPCTRYGLPPTAHVLLDCSRPLDTALYDGGGGLGGEESVCAWRHVGTIHSRDTSSSSRLEDTRAMSALYRACGVRA